LVELFFFHFPMKVAGGNRPPPPLMTALRSMFFSQSKIRPLLCEPSLNDTHQQY